LVFRFHRLFAFTGFAITAFMIKLYATSALRFLKLYAYMNSFAAHFSSAALQLNASSSSTLLQMTPSTAEGGESIT